MSSILVVDDEAPMREFYHRALAAGGYNPLDVRTAEEALDFLALTSDITVAVVDLNMPGRGGVWLIEQLRERFPHVAVILATADESVSGSLSLQPSVVSYLVKPISAETLLRAVRDAVDTQRERPTLTNETSSAIRAGGDPIEAWLDKKLTHRHGDAPDTEK
jgi:DNA-binding NtrC family response regulator